MIILGLYFSGFISENEFKKAMKIWIGVLISIVVFFIAFGIYMLFTLIHG